MNKTLHSSFFRSATVEPTMKTKVSKAKLSPSATTILISAFALVFFLFNRTFSTSPVKTAATEASKSSFISSSSLLEGGGSANGEEDEIEQVQKPEFSPGKCDVTDGKWVFERSLEPLYTDRGCSYLERQETCGMNGRPDSDYRYWQWHPVGCTLPRFNPNLALRNLQGKKLVFVGDSLVRSQWQSFVCLVQSVISDDQKSVEGGIVHSVFTAKEYNTTIEFHWAPFVVESNSDTKIVWDPTQRILKVDCVSQSSKNWTDVDFLVFGSYTWWASNPRIKIIRGLNSSDEQVHEELETAHAYKIGMKTWANWVDSKVDASRTKVFFTTMSPTHSRSADWGRPDGIQCFNETKPIMKKGHWGFGSDKRLMIVVEETLEKMRMPVTVINVTQISEYRIDGHTSVYTERGGQLLTDEEKANPMQYVDCFHWCLPGVPDTWNQILLASL